MVCVGTALRGLDVFVIVLERKEMFETCHAVSFVISCFLALHDGDELYTSNECQLLATDWTKQIQLAPEAGVFVLANKFISLICDNSFTTQNLGFFRRNFQRF